MPLHGLIDPSPHWYRWTLGDLIGMFTRDLKLLPLFRAHVALLVRRIACQLTFLQVYGMISAEKYSFGLY